MPKVSVIVATKNEEKNIVRNLRSIKRQTFRDIEVIVVDNYSTDNTVKLSRKYTRTVYTHGPERSAQRNYGVNKARGEYVLIIDADMELAPGVVQSCLENIKSHKMLIIPERTVGKSFLARVRAFERSMYVGDPTIEVARFFDKKVFEEFGGYDLKLTGTEDYDLPKRIMDKYGMQSLGWATEWVMHHEAQRTLFAQLKRKYYYAQKSAAYAGKHPDLIATQGNMLFRKTYFRNWKKFLFNPVLGISFIFIRILESSWAIVGYISAVGLGGFLRTFFSMFKK